MPENAASAGVPPEISELLGRLRWRIRLYVGLEGLSLAILWIGFTFWVALALDYLPVLAGIGEMPRTARAVLLIAVAGVLGWILYRSLLRRLFVRLADHSLAILLERRYRDFRDSLITSVELNTAHQPTSPAGREMLAETQRDALQGLQSVRITDVFQWRPLFFRLGGAMLLAVTWAAFYVVNGSAFEIGVNRLYFLGDQPWPRQARIEVVGVELRGNGSAEDSAVLVPFQDGSLKAAKGSHLSLLVRADASRPSIPDVCSVIYHTEEGDRGRVNMTRVGRIRDGYQWYKYDGKPFDGVLSEITFDVIGFDHRVRANTVHVVDSPTVVEVQLACQFPSYMVDEKLSQWLPRTVSYTAGLQLPRGTRFQLQCRSNKPLTQVELVNPDTAEQLVLNIDPGASEQGASEPGASAGGSNRIASDSTAFEYSVASLGDHLTLDVILTDTDRVRSERPYRIHVTGIEDTPPAIEMRLVGIGTAVTPDVIVPARGQVTDDYGLDSTVVEIVVNDGEPQLFPFQPSAAGAAETAVDFRSERGKPDGTTLQPKDKLHYVIKATDRCDLGNGPNQATGDHYELEVVTPEQLLAMLEGRELGLRRRFEQIVEEMTGMRDMVQRVKTDGPATASADAVDDAAAAPARESAATAEDRLERVWSLRLLRSRQSLLQSQKSAQEVLGIAAAFLDIREELINNRVDTQDRKQRLQEQIADPLQRIGSELFPELDRRLEKLTVRLLDVEQRRAFAEEDSAAVAAAQLALDQTQQILNEMDAVLNQMLDLESFNELLDIVRSLIDEQERLMDDTKKEQKKALLDLLK